MSASITSKGQVTIPKEVRVNLGVVSGDRLDFVRLDDGNYAIIPASRSIRSLKGVIPRPAAPVTLEDMDAAIEAGAKGV